MLAPARPQDALDQLIEEARARQLRRRLTATVVVALAIAGGLIGYSVARDNGGKSASQSARPGTAAFALSPACTRSRLPRLVLSRASGPAGTVVSVTGCGCPNTEGQADQVSWFNNRAERSPVTGGPYRRIQVTRISHSSADATFVVKRWDPLGRGVLDMWCGGLVGNAVRHFTVTR